MKNLEVHELQSHPFAPHVVSSMPQKKNHSQSAAVGVGGCHDVQHFPCRGRAFFRKSNQIPKHLSCLGK